MKTVILFLLIFPIVSFRALQDRLKFFEAKNCDPNCTFFDGNLTIETIDNFPKECTTVCSDLFIGYRNNLTEEQVESTFKNLKHLIGTLQVIGTTFVRGSFLAGLESIETDYGNVEFINNRNMSELDLSNLTSLNCTELRIQQNFDMINVKLPNLKNLTTTPSFIATFPVKVVIAYLSSNYCIKFDEMEHFLSLDLGDFGSIYANYCTPTADDKTCRKPEQGCKRFLGDLKIDSNFSEFDSLNSIEALFGRLIVVGSNLTNLSFLSNLKYIAPLGWDSGSIVFLKYENEESKAFQLQNNSKLIDYMLPSLKRIRSDSVSPVIIRHNNEALLMNSKSCHNLQAALVNQHVNVDSDFCFSIEDKEKRRDQGNEKQTKMWLIVIGIGCAIALIILLTTVYCCCLKKKRVQ